VTFGGLVNRFLIQEADSEIETTRSGEPPVRINDKYVAEVGEERGLETVDSIHANDLWGGPGKSQ
jgi:hypothetical protein